MTRLYGGMAAGFRIIRLIGVHFASKNADFVTRGSDCLGCSRCGAAKDTKARCKRQMSRRTQQHLWNWTVRAIAVAILTGCSHQQPFVDSGKEAEDFDRDLLKQVSNEEEVDGLPPDAVVIEPTPRLIRIQPRSNTGTSHWIRQFDRPRPILGHARRGRADHPIARVEAHNLLALAKATDPGFEPAAAFLAFDA
jgi:hypothetical protein